MRAALMDSAIPESADVAGTAAPKCPLCGAASSWPLAHQHNAEFERMRADAGDRRPYFWRLCRTCGNGFPAFQPDLALLAKVWQAGRSDADAGPEKKEARWRERRRISVKGAKRSFAAFAPLHGGPPGRFLDVACGLGETVRMFAGHGWDAFGVDADPEVRRFHQELGIKSEIGQIEAVPVSGRFDIIHIAHAIYFVTGPLTFLGWVRERLSEDGLLCVVLADFMASDDLGLPGYPHSFFPTGSSMRFLLARAGFRVCFSRSRSGSVYIAARVGEGPPPPVFPALIRLGYRTKKFRYWLLGLPKLWLHRLGKAIIGSR